MLLQLVGGGILSKETGIELNTASKPDEKARVEKEAKIKEEKNLNNSQPVTQNGVNTDNTNNGIVVPVKEEV